MKKKYIILFIILVSAFIMRFILIDFGLPSKNLALTTYNPDEPLSYYTIEKWNPKKLDFHPHRAFFWGGFHLFPLAGSLGIAKVIGYVKFGNREFYVNNLKEADKLYLVGRFLMILFAVASVLLIFLILKEAYDELLGLFGAFLFAITPTHIFSSIYVRPDIMMLFFGLLSLYFSIKLLKSSATKYYFLSCISVGFATGTKLSGAVYGIAPLLAHFLTTKEGVSQCHSEERSDEESQLRCRKNKILHFVQNDKMGYDSFLKSLKEKFKDIRLYLIPLICVLAFCLSSPYVLIDFNRTQESFLSYLKMNPGLAKGTMDFGQYMLLGTGIMSYLKYYLPYGLGMGIVIGGIIGFFLMLFNIVKNRDKFDLLFIISGLVVLLVISSTKHQIVWYTFPVVPLTVVYFVRGINILSQLKLQNLKILGYVFAVIVFCYTAVYTIAYWRLYFEKNIREKASEWIEKNIPKGSSIAIARSYFWTPGILRQYNPPYKLLMGGDPINSSIDEAFLGLEKILPETEYLVLTEYEYRNFVHPKLEKYFPKQVKIIKEIMFSNKFKKIIEFDKEAKFLWFTFKKNYPPIDWLIPNPKIIVFRKVIR